ncbi:uncharacterized protein B0T23DRAFT_401829 [Neurospora hispaniola]|uniref:DUF8021 domain-containing protein n=1 Tax=Neurospora hispaniola TaxID=588809 RepID=A0AAJ0IHC7_9PEZI|nr:hypothetical protein B0T23DRAFT_401829 [Neurospora hispaniola]
MCASPSSPPSWALLAILSSALLPTTAAICNRKVLLTNNKPTVIISRIFNHILRIDFNRTIIDLTTCSTFTEVVHATSFKTFIDTIISVPFSWLFNASRTIQYARQENWPIMPLAQRDTRHTLQAAADTYLDMWSNKSKGAPDDSCKVDMPSNNTQPPNSDRRHVIDESTGTVSFRLEGSKLRYVHTITVADSSAWEDV